MGEKSPTFGFEKKKWCVRKNTPKNQKELNGIEAIYIVVVVLTFTLSLFNYSLFYVIFFHVIFFTLDFFMYVLAYRAYR